MTGATMLGTDASKPGYVQIDPPWKGVVRWGGLSLLAAGVCLVVFVVSVFALQQPLPVPAKQALENPTVPATLFLVAAVGELLLMPGALGLYFALRNVRNTPMFIATALWVLAVPMFLASRGLIMALSQLSDRYTTTTDATMKAAYLASAELALEVQNVYATMGLVLLCVASIIIGIVMLKGGFGSRTGSLAILAGALTLFSPFEVIMEIPIIIPFVGLVLTATWQLIAGAKLYRLGRVA